MRRKGTSVVSEGAGKATGETTERERTKQRRFSAGRKLAVVLRLLRGEDLDQVSRELGVGAGTLSAWREDFLAGGESNLKKRQPTVQDEEIRRLKAMVGELTMRNEVLREKARALEANLPLARRRSRR